MAIQLVSGNLNKSGDKGQFEADISTWWWGGSVNISRSNSFFTKGIYSCRTAVPTGYSNSNLSLKLAWAHFPTVAGKTYIAYARVKTNVGSPAAADGVVVQVNSDDAPTYITVLEQLSKTIGQVKNDGNAFVQIYAKFQAVVTEENFEIDVRLTKLPGEAWNPGNAVWLDQIEVYEYIDLGCNLLIDQGGTVIVNESAPGAADGSITVATSGGDAPFEYSKDGIAWQASNVFNGLAAGSYSIRVREQADPTCSDLKSFDVHLTNDPDFDFNLEVDNESLPGANDGKITGTKTGAGTAPFEWRKDAGAWQASGEFTGLAPGTYLISLKDATGKTVTHYATVAEGEFVYDKAYLSRNPIPFVVGAQAGYEALDNYRIYCDTRVEEVSGSGNFVSQLKQELEPDTNGTATFQLRQAFRKVLKAIPTEVETGIKILTDRIKLYKNYTGHLQNDEVTPAVLTASLQYLVMLGGIDKLNYPGVDYLSTYLTANKKFLTWAPVEKEVDALQEDYLNFFIYKPLINVITVYQRIYFDDNTTQTINVVGGSGFKQGQLLQIASGPANTNVTAVNPAKNIVKYEIWLQDQNNNVISEIRTYVLAKYHHPLTKFLMILNSLGSWEIHRFTGQAEFSEVYDRTVVQKHLPHNYQKLDGESEVREVISSGKRIYSSGFIKGKYSEEWMNYMRELARSRMIYEITTTGTRIPLKNVTRDFTFMRDQDYERYIRIEAEEVYSNESFTPEL